MLNTNPAGVDRAHVLPDDWLERLLQFRPVGALTPFIEALQSIARKHGEAAIGIEHVQELALLVCGLSEEPRFVAYEHVFASLSAAAGADWCG